MHAGGLPLRQLAFSATLHCLTGCAIGEVSGMVIGTGLGWADAPTIVLSVALAFLFGYALTLRPLLASGIALVVALGIAFVAAFPVNYWLIRRGRGHAVIHQHHGHQGH
jgi:Domain of unknown function (DUF4396)